MKISKCLFTSKVYKNGEHPVMLRIYHKKIKYISTSVTCQAKHWNKKTLQVSSRDPRYKEKNDQINSIYLKYQNRWQELIDNKVEPTIENLLSEESIEKTDETNLIWLFKAKSDTCEAPRTEKEYLTFKRVFEALYGSYIDINTIDQKWVDNMRERIDEYYGEHNSQKNHLIKCFKGVYTFADEKEYLKNPKKLKCKNFLHIKGETDLTNEQVSTIINAYKKDIVENARGLKKSEKEALGVFIFMLAFQGLSNIDLASLKKEDLTFESAKKIDVEVEKYHNNKEYKDYVDREQEIREVVIVQTKRRKTKIPVKIVCDKESIIPILELFYDGKENDEYLIPCFSAKKERDKTKEMQRCGNYFNNIEKKLKSYLDEYCTIHGYSKIPKITYYMARHAFVNRVSNLDVPHNLIRKLIGHKEGVLEKYYLIPLTKWEQAHVTFRIFNDEVSIRQLLSQRTQQPY
ncbi:MAG: hypothetical protein HDS37_06370 [Bacteroides sp.]|nr:hypothetical protein [Bacteroides sp.]